jgi:hypothetical protein
MAEFFAGLSLFKSMYDAAKDLKDMNDATIRNGAVIELQEKILSAQREQAELIEIAGALKARVAELEAWDADKKRYKLADLGRGMSVYSLKDGMENGEPPHHLCAACYNEGHKSIMQTETRSPGRCQVLVCHRCGSDLYLSVDSHSHPFQLPIPIPASPPVAIASPVPQGHSLQCPAC